MNIEDIKIDNIKEEDLDIIYIYLDAQFKFMSNEEKIMWIGILKLIDKEFDHVESNNA